MTGVLGGSSRITSGEIAELRISMSIMAPQSGYQRSVSYLSLRMGSRYRDAHFSIMGSNNTMVSDKKKDDGAFTDAM